MNATESLSERLGNVAQRHKSRRAEKAQRAGSDFKYQNVNALWKELFIETFPGTIVSSMTHEEFGRLKKACDQRGLFDQPGIAINCIEFAIRNWPEIRHSLYVGLTEQEQRTFSREKYKPAPEIPTALLLSTKLVKIIELQNQQIQKDRESTHGSPEWEARRAAKINKEMADRQYRELHKRNRARPESYDDDDSDDALFRRHSGVSDAARRIWDSV